VADILHDGVAHEAGGASIADAVLAHLHPTVSATEELDALPVGGVVLTRLGEVVLKRHEPSGEFKSWWAMAGTAEYFQSRELYLPGTVLYSPVSRK
jgi:hypothetical protein